MYDTICELFLGRFLSFYGQAQVQVQVHFSLALNGSDEP